MRPRLVLVAVLAAILSAISHGAFACTYIDELAAAQEAVRTTTCYLAGTAACAVVLFIVEARSARRRLVIMGYALAAIALHPRWTLPSLHGPDCVFVNVWASQIILGTTILLLAVQGFPLLLARLRR